MCDFKKVRTLERIPPKESWNDKWYFILWENGNRDLAFFAKGLFYKPYIENGSMINRPFENQPDYWLEEIIY